MTSISKRLIGKVTVRGDNLPPKGSKLEVRLLGERGTVVASQKWDAAGQAAISYSMRVPSDRIDPAKTYHVDAEIRDREGVPRWQTIDGGKPVLTQGNPAEADLLVFELP